MLLGQQLVALAVWQNYSIGSGKMAEILSLLVITALWHRQHQLENQIALITCPGFHYKSVLLNWTHVRTLLTVAVCVDTVQDKHLNDDEICLCVCVWEGWEGGRKMPLAENSGGFQPSHILLLCVFTHGHKRTHCTWSVTVISSVQSEATQCKSFHMLSTGKYDQATFYSCDIIIATTLIILLNCSALHNNKAKAVMPL